MLLRSILAFSLIDRRTSDVCILRSSLRRYTFDEEEHHERQQLRRTSCHTLTEIV